MILNFLKIIKIVINNLNYYFKILIVWISKL